MLETNTTDFGFQTFPKAQYQEDLLSFRSQVIFGLSCLEGKLIRLWIVVVVVVVVVVVAVVAAAVNADEWIHFVKRRIEE